MLLQNASRCDSLHANGPVITDSTPVKAIKFDIQDESMQIFDMHAQLVFLPLITKVKRF